MLFDSALYPIDVVIFLFMSFSMLYAFFREVEERQEKMHRAAARHARARRRAQMRAELRAADR